jgi:hypothetical protein
MTIQLTIGEQTTAAMTVQDAVPALHRQLRDLGSALELDGAGFERASGLGEALTAWFDAAGTLGPIMEGYALALLGVDLEHAHNDCNDCNDCNEATAYSRLAARLGGAA